MHVNGQPGVCHVAHGFLSVGKCTVRQVSHRRAWTGPPLIWPHPAHSSKSANRHYPIQYKDSIAPPPASWLSARRYGTSTRCSGHKMRTWKFFQPVRIFDEGYWHNAFTRINICHRIGANDLAILRHDAGLLTIQVEHLAKGLVLSTSCGQSREPLP